jgi:hypothetical protein
MPSGLTTTNVIRTYRFSARPLGEIPPELWTVALNSQRFWNQLVELRDSVAFNSETLPENAEAIRTRFWDLLTSKSPECKKWRIAIKRAADLPWATRDAVFDRFVDCCRRAAKRRSGWPHIHNRSDRIMILHRFTDGGRAVKNVYLAKKSGWRFGLKPVPMWVYEGRSRYHTNGRLSSGFFGFSEKTRLNFEVVLHRPLPVDAIVKNVAWVGRRHQIHGWQWAIAITVKLTNPIVQRETFVMCGIDFGWRARQDYVRVGMLSDSEGNVLELRLPLDAPTSKTRRHKLDSGYYDLLRIDHEIDKKLNEAKAALLQQAQFDIPKELLTELPQVRQGGLVHLLRDFEANKVVNQAQAILCEWLSENDRLRSLRAALQDRLIRRRRWLYRNMAAFLTNRYQTIALEDEFGAKEMIEDRVTKDRDLPFQRSIRHYQWAAVAELRSYILEAAAKNGAQIVEASTRGSTSTCFICGKYTVHKPNLRLTCPNGHTWDQDVNASANILRASGNLGGGPKKVHASSMDMLIPDILAKVITAV